MVIFCFLPILIVDKVCLVFRDNKNRSSMRSAIQLEMTLDRIMERGYKIGLNMFLA